MSLVPAQPLHTLKSLAVASPLPIPAATRIGRDLLTTYRYSVPFTTSNLWPQAGDTGAKQALGFVGNDYGYNPNMVGGNTGVYNS
jgi:hypothetical protein